MIIIGVADWDDLNGLQQMAGIHKVLSLISDIMKPPENNSCDEGIPNIRGQIEWHYWAKQTNKQTSGLFIPQG